MSSFKYFFLAILRAILVGVSPFLCYADRGGFEIEGYDVDIQLQQDGSMQVQETIDVEFLEPRHGIYRDIPLVYQVSGHYFRIMISDTTVQDDPFVLQDTSQMHRIRIGSPDETIQGSHTYTISYDVYGAVKKFSGYQEFSRNLIGTQWAQPIKTFDFSLNFPKPWTGITTHDMYMYHGQYGLQNTGDMESWYTSTGLQGSVFVPLEPYAAFTVGLKFPPDFFDLDDVAQESLIVHTDTYIPSPPLFRTWDQGFHRPMSLYIFLVIAGTFGLIIFRLYQRNYTSTIRQDDIIAPFYDPPKGISPSEAGVLVDDTLDPHDITAMIYQRAGQGYLNIRQDKKKSGRFSSKTEYSLERTSKAFPLQDVAEYERVFWEKLFAKREVFHLKHQSTFTKYVKRAINVLEDVVLNKDRYTVSSLQHKDTKHAGNAFIFLFFGMIAWIISLWAMDMWHLKYDQSVHPIRLRVIILLTIGIVVRMFYMPQEEILTPQGQTLRTHLLGYKKFLLQVEEPVLQKMLEQDPLYVNKVLPFAIVFGIQTKFLQKITPLLEEPPEWHKGNMTTFHHLALASIAAVNTASHYVPPSSTNYSSSSGFSGGSSFGGGGGFSGGGGGGGGGGSW